MITKWKVFNFKSVRKETELDLAPLTIFAGANSSGKSTFLQSILLVAQTLSHKVSSRSVVLNGAFARLGQFDDLRSADSDTDQILVGWTCVPFEDPQGTRIRQAGYRRSPVFYRGRRSALTSVSCEIAFDAAEGGTKSETTQIQPRLEYSQLSAVARGPEGTDETQVLNIRRAAGSAESSKQVWLDALPAENAMARASLVYDVDLDDVSLAEIHEELISAIPVGCVPRHFLPDRLSVGVDLVLEDARLICGTLLGEGPRGIPRRMYVDREVLVPRAVVELVLNKAGSVNAEIREALTARIDRGPDLFGSTEVPLEHLHEAIRRVTPRMRMEIRRELAETADFEELVRRVLQRERDVERAVLPFRPPGILADAAGYLDEFFSTSVRYLGPLRDEPKSLYPLAPTADPSDVGLKGEHTAAVLDLHKNRPVRYIPTSAFAEAEISARPASRSLEVAVIDWLRYLGVAESVRSRDRGKLGHELTITVSGTERSHDLTHVGVGVSQVLPILVVSLLADPDTTLIFEQPELHLHPKVQTLLADFFLSMTALGKQCIVETHSEYLINRLRFRTAAAMKSNPWVSATKVYFVERPPDGSVFREVKINEYGAVLDWPEGFFDQSQQEAEAILRAASSKRKWQRGK